MAMIWAFYRQSGRHDLPWRKTTDPYKIAVSEVMLQQTQVGRVIEKYKEFLKAFPTARSLANAPLQQVLLLWSGLGYNRRARFLQKMAQTVTLEYVGVFPKDFDTLLKLPGIGQYTAGAISAFAYNKPVPIIETNIRTVYLHHFFFAAPKSLKKTKAGGELVDDTISDKELLPLITETLDHKNPREWYWALMDYGSYLKSTGVRIHRNSKQYVKQSTFKGSLREVRGGVLRILTKQSVTGMQLQKTLSFEKERIDQAVMSLMQEGVISRKGNKLGISNT